MNALSHEALQLLDFLCAVHARRGMRVKRLKRFADSVRVERLRDAALIRWHSLEPTPWAFHDWQTRQSCAENQTERKCLLETPAQLPALAGPSEPPAPAAVDGGGGADARCGAASPPNARGFYSDTAPRQLLREIELFCAEAKMPVTALGRRACADPALCNRLKRAHSVKQSTVEKVRSFIQSARAEAAACPPAPVRAEGPAFSSRTPAHNHKRKGPPTMAERARRFEEQRNNRGTSGDEGRGSTRAPAVGLANGPNDTKRRRPDTAASPRFDEYPGACGTPREGPAAAESTAASRTTGRAPLHGPAVRSCPAPSGLSTRPSGAELADSLVRWCEGSGASQIRLSLHLFGSQSGIRTLRESKRPKQATIDKVTAFLANPVAPERLPERPRPRCSARRSSYSANTAGSERGAKIAAAIRRGIRKQAAKALDAGEDGRNAAVRGAMIEIAEQRADQARLADPVEQAKLLIRRSGYRCFDARVELGEKKGKGKFFVGSRLVDEVGLFAFAERLKARAA
jgi:hypothetical protein